MEKQKRFDEIVDEMKNLSVSNDPGRIKKIMALREEAKNILGELHLLVYSTYENCLNGSKIMG